MLCSLGIRIDCQERHLLFIILFNIIIICLSPKVKPVSASCWLRFYPEPSVVKTAAPTEHSLSTSLIGNANTFRNCSSTQRFCWQKSRKWQQLLNKQLNVFMINVNICHRCAGPNSWTPLYFTAWSGFYTRTIQSQISRQNQVCSTSQFYNMTYILYTTQTLASISKAWWIRRGKRMIDMVAYSDFACQVRCDAVIKVASGGDGKFPLLIKGVKTSWLSRLTNAWCTV